MQAALTTTWKSLFLARFRQIRPPAVLSRSLGTSTTGQIGVHKGPKWLQGLKDPARIVRNQLHKYWELAEGGFITDHIHKFLATRQMRPGGPCPALWTLDLEEGLKTNQWLRLDRLAVARYIIHGDKVLGSARLRIPSEVVHGAHQGEVWVCPYWNDTEQAICFRINGLSQDLLYKLPVSVIGNATLWPLGELAKAQGYIDSYTVTTKVGDHKTSGVRYARYVRAKAGGYEGSRREYNKQTIPSIMLLRHYHENQGHVGISSLKRENALLGPGNKIAPGDNSRRIKISGATIGQVRIPIDKHRQRHVYFDPERKCLSFLTPEGLPIPGADFPMELMATKSGKRLLLQLAKHEGLLDRIPDPHATQLEFERARASGYAISVNVASASSRAILTMRLPGRRSDSLLFKRPIKQLNQDWISLMPYIDAQGEFRLWNVQASEDAMLRGPIFMSSFNRPSLTGAEVKSMYPNLFAFAQSLGYWKDL